MVVDRPRLAVAVLLCAAPWAVRADCGRVLSLECGTQCHPGDASCAFECT
jgi:hypothetical protein